MKTLGNTVHIFENLTAIFDIHPLTGVGLDTFVDWFGLTLKQNGSYTALVIAVDESGTCATVAHTFRVDTSPPEEGRIGVGPIFELVFMFKMYNFVN